MIIKRRNRIYFSLFIVFLILFTSGIVFIASGVETGSLLLKVTLNKGDSITKFITMSSDVGGEFALSVENAEGVTLSDDNFVLDEFEEKEVGVQFNTASLTPGVYIGHIRVDNEEEVSIIPVIFEVEENLLFDINLNIPPQFTQIEPGGSFLAQVQIFDLTGGLGPTTVNMEYFLYNLNGNVLSSESESVVIDGQTSFTKTLTLPFDIESGDYIYVAVAKYLSSVGTSSSLVNVQEEPSFSPLSGGNNFLFFIVIAVFLIVFLSVSSLFAYFVHDRGKLVVELRRYNVGESKKQREFLLAQMRVLKNRRPRYVKDIEREVEQKVSKLRSKQKTRLDEFRKLRKEGKVKEMRHKLIELKRRERDTLLLESRIKGLTLKEMKNMMAELHKIKGVMEELKETVNIKSIKFSDAAGQIRKFEYQKGLLENAYDRGYIKRNSYGKGKKKLNKIINKLKKRL